MFENGIYSWRESIGKTLSIAIAGDVCPSDGAVEDILAGKSAEILRGIQDVLDKADLRLIQWETPISSNENPILKSGPNLLVPPGCEDFIVKGKFDVALLANNHTGDHSADAVIETIDYIRKAGVQTVGAGSDARDAAKPLHITKNGFKISILNFCETEFGTAGEDTPGANAMDEMVNIIQIAEERKENDIVLVIIHGGNEHNPLPSPRVRKLYAVFAHAGASAVINIHTHCPQGIEIVNNVPIVYCLGNFFFPKRKTIPFDLHNYWWSGYLPRISFDEQGAYEIEITPYCFSPNPWKIEALQGKQRIKFLEYVDKISRLAVEEGDYWFDLWCASRCRDFVVGWIKRSPMAELEEDLTDPAALKRLPVIRHLFSCQAHCEVANRSFRLIEQGRVTELIAELPKLRELKQADFCD